MLFYSLLVCFISSYFLDIVYVELLLWGGPVTMEIGGFRGVLESAFKKSSSSASRYSDILIRPCPKSQNKRQQQQRTKLETPQ